MQTDERKGLSMVEIKIGNVEALGKPLGQYSHLTRVKDASETLYIAGMLAPGETSTRSAAACSRRSRPR